jgi:hypothetical protein
VADAEDQNEQPIVFDITNETVVAHAVFPEFPEPGAVHGLANAARIVEWCDALVEKFQNALSLRRVELSQVAVDLGGELRFRVGHLVGHPLTPKIYYWRITCRVVFLACDPEFCVHGNRGTLSLPTFAAVSCL